MRSSAVTTTSKPWSSSPAIAADHRYPDPDMPTSLVTGGAGFLGSHLCDYLISRGHRVICVDNLETGSLENIRHLKDGSTSGSRCSTSRATTSWTSRSTSSTTWPRRPPRSTTRGCRCTRSRWARTAPTTRSASRRSTRAVPARLDLRGVRRPARAPAAGDLLGQRQPDRPARRLRRGEALRRGADDGLPAPAGRGHGDRADLQHLRAADAAERRPRHPDLPAARRSPTGR